MNVCRAACILSICLFFMRSAACAEQDEVILEEIVVTSARIPQVQSSAVRKVDVITGSEIASSGAQNLAELLSSYRSVLGVGDYGGIGAVKNLKMRGSTASQVLVLIDGRPANSPRDGQLDFSTIPLSDIERIEIMRGPGSSLYGSQAMGGTIHIITKDPPADGYETAVESSFGTYRSLQERLRHGGRLGEFGYLFTGEYQDSEGIRDNADYDAKSASAKFTYDLHEAHRFTLSSGFFTSKVGAPGLLSSFDSDDRQRTRKSFGSLDWVSNPDEHTRLNAKAYRSYERMSFAENSAGSMFDTALKKDIHSTTSDGYELQASRRLTDWYQGITGFSYVGNTNDSTATAKHEYTVRAWFLENQFDLLENLRVTLAGRIDDYSNFGSEASPDLGILYAFTDTMRIRGRLSRSFRAPTFNDLYWPDEGWVRGNSGLKPERGTTAEIGFESALGEYLSFAISGYRSEFDDLILWAPDASFVWLPQNVGRAVIKGIEPELTWHITPELEAYAGYTYVTARDADSDKYLVYQPRNKINLSLRYETVNDLVFVFHAEYTGRRYHDAANTISVKHYYVFGFDLLKRITENLSVFTSVKNLLNRQYQVLREYPMPGFSITSGVKLEF